MSATVVMMLCDLAMIFAMFGSVAWAAFCLGREYERVKSDGDGDGGGPFCLA